MPCFSSASQPPHFSCFDQYPTTHAPCCANLCTLEMRLWKTRYPASRFCPVDISAAWCGYHMHAVITSFIIHQNSTGPTVLRKPPYSQVLVCIHPSVIMMDRHRCVTFESSTSSESDSELDFFSASSELDSESDFFSVSSHNASSVEHSAESLDNDNDSETKSSKHPQSQVAVLNCTFMDLISRLQAGKGKVSISSIDNLNV
jgi:hypothetical protein